MTILVCLFVWYSSKPIIDLVSLLATLHTADGNIAVTGLTENVRELTEDERRRFEAVELDAASYRDSLGVDLRSEDPMVCSTYVCCTDRQTALVATIRAWRQASAHCDNACAMAYTTYVSLACFVCLSLGVAAVTLGRTSVDSVLRWIVEHVADVPHDPPPS